jgi:arylsulfatase A-like enzyme
VGSIRPRVLLLGQDGFPPSGVTPADTPVLWALGESGGRAREGGGADLPSTTYPGFAALLTGRHGSRADRTSPWHGVRTTSHDGLAVPGWAGRRSVRGQTLLHVARDAGLWAGAILGDHKLHRVLRLGDLTRWPAGGRVPEGAVTDAHGYPANAAVRGPLLAAAAADDWDVLFVHLNEVDTLGHDLGPEDPRTIAGRRNTDELVGELLEALRPAWTRTTVMVASDHGMDAVADLPAIDPAAAPGVGGLLDGWIGDGGAAWVRVRRGADRAAAGEAIASLDGVAGWVPHGTRRLLVLARPGRRFAGSHHRGGVHGSPSTARTVAIVGGGHGAVASIARSIALRPPHLADWAPAAAAVLGVPFGVAGQFGVVGPPVLLADDAAALPGR